MRRIVVCLLLWLGLAVPGVGRRRFREVVPVERPQQVEICERERGGLDKGRQGAAVLHV